MANLLSTTVTGTVNTTGRVVVGGNFSNNPYNSVASTRLHFGGGDSDANDNYYIGTNLNNYGGNYTKLDLRWHTGIRMGARPEYGGIRFFNNETLASRIMSIGETDGNVRIDNILIFSSSNSTMISNGSMTDAIGYNTSYGTYIGSTVGGTYYIYGNGRFYDNGTVRTLIHSGNIASQSVSYADNAGNLGGLSSGKYPKQDYYYSSSQDWNTIEAADTTSAIVLRIESAVQNPPANDVYNWSLWQQGTRSRGSQIAVAAYGEERIYFRGSNFDTGSYHNWNEIIHSGNISSQSVGYASSAGSADNIDGWGFRNTGSNEAVNADTINSNGITYYANGVPNFSGNATDGALYSQRYSDSWQHQIAGDYRSGMIAVRGRNNGTWTSWKTIIDSSTIGSQSVNYATSSGNSATTSQIVFSDLKINFPSGAGGGHSFGANHYSMGLDVGNGGWDHPHYRDVIIGYHTGIRIGANYSGVRFYSDSPTTDANNDGNGDGTEKLLMTVGGYVGTANHTDVVVNNNLFANVSMRAPIFYDSADTGYYLDPNGTSNLNQISASTSARWGRSGNFWTVRPSIHAGVGYWTGTNGWGTGEGTWANAWKGGFSGWDIWGTGTDHPQGSGYVHAQGIVSGIHYVSPDGGDAYGWMMVGAADAVTNRYWLRGKWGTTTSAWTEIMTSNQNTYAWNMDQWVRTTDSVSFAATTSPTFLVNSHSDNTKGYRIYNTSNSSVSAMFTNSSNALVIAAGAFDQINLNKKVYVNGVALGVNVAPSGTAGRIDASNDIVAYSSSDERLKYNISPIENALDKVKSLTGVEFDWKPEYKHAHGYEGHDTGIIAQQVQEVIPSAVRTNDTGFLAVRYEKLIGLLVEGMKEQQAQIEELKAKLDGLTK